MPIFKRKLGEDKPMQLFLKFKNFDVKFGEYDNDVVLSYTACLDFRYDLAPEDHAESLFYDEIPIVTTGLVKQDKNILFITILGHRLNHDAKGYSQKNFPVKDKMKISEMEYKEFETHFAHYLNKQKEWVNEHVLRGSKGLHLPMGTEEIKVDLEFREGRMHIFLEIMKNAGKWLEEEWWDTDYK